MQMARSNSWSRRVAEAFAALFILFALGTPCIARAQHSAELDDLRGRYFLVVWAYQGPDDDLVHAHTFVSFYRGNDLAKGVIHPVTISWLPATGKVPLFGVVRGHNFSLDQTLSSACRAGRAIKSWGPYEVRPELFRSAMRRVRLLQSHRIKYSMIDAPPKAMNCITAAGDLTQTRLHTGILWGVAASAEVVRHLSPYFIGSEKSSLLGGLVTRSLEKACPGRGGQLASGAAPLP